MPNNQQSQWVNGQVVNATQMTALTQDLYNKLTFITQNYKPCILYLNGDVTQVDSNVTIPDGAFRFEDSDNSAILQYNTGIFGNAQGTTLAVTGDGYIVARYVLNPIIPNQYNYTFATSYVFVATPIADTDVVICVITAGVISQKSGIFPYQDITDNPTDGNVTIGGRVVNSVNNIKTLGDAGKLSGVVTGNEGSILYVTEPDGETINTAVVNQYGYRPFHNGTATAILDPENTFAYVSELPVANNFIKHKTSNTVGGPLVMNATFNGINWSGTIHGAIEMYVGANPSGVIQMLQLDALLGINGLSAVCGSLSFVTSNFSFNKSPCQASVVNIGIPNQIRLELVFPSSVSGNSFLGYFSASFNATSIT